MSAVRWTACEPIHPPTQEATVVKPWRYAQRVSSEALAKEDTLRRVVAEESIGTMAAKPWAPRDGWYADPHMNP
jgi:hypothetical protein